VDARTTPLTARKVMTPPLEGEMSQYAPIALNTSTPTGIVEKSPPPPLSLQHLSLETQDPINGAISRSNRLGFSARDNIPEPASAIEPTHRPMFPPRTSSSNSLRLGTNSTLPIRQPPPTGPLPPPPTKDLPAIPSLQQASNAVSPRRYR
jgi:hypothetical protein